MNIIYLFH